MLALHKPEPKAKGKEQRPVLSLVEGAKGKREEQEKTDLAKPETQNSQPETVIRMKLVGANPDPQVTGLDKLPGKSNYLIGNDPKNWHTNVPTYARVQHREVYPGIDLVYYGNQRQLEYDFVVAPGADPRVITLAFDGLVGAGPRAGLQEGDHRGSPLRIDDNGDLILHTAGDDIRLHKPRIYQEINGVKHPILGGYVLLEPETQNSKLETPKVGFQVTAYDTSKPLIIDPTLSYSTYLGGSNIDYGSGIAVDSSGNAYVTGWTSSANFPTANPLQPDFGGDYDAFVAKLNATGSALVYSTYLGGSSYDAGLGIAVDSAGNAYVTGQTSSTNFPTANPLQPAFGGDYDAMVARFSASKGNVFCPATVALEGAPQEEAKLEVLYDFRDEVLASTPTGQRYIDLFYKHAEEGVGLMFSYPELLSHTRTLLEHFLPMIQAVMAGLEVTVTAADLADIEALLEAFAAQASPELQADLRAIQEDLRQGVVLEQFGIMVR